MTYLIAKFGIVMLLAAFSASFIPAEYLLFLVFVAVFAAVGLCVLKKRLYEFSALIIAAAIGFGISAYETCVKIYPATALDGFSAEISGTVKEVDSGSGNPVYTVETDYIGIDGAVQKTLIQLSGWEENYAEPFDKISCEATFQVYEETDLAEMMTNRSRGVSVHAFLDSPLEITGKEDSTFEYYVYRIREKFSSIIYKYYLGWHAPFTEQILLGTRGELDYEISAAFRRSGMSHILVVSGIHMVIIVGLFENILCFKKTDGNLRKAEIVLLIFITAGYMFIGGLGLSVMRSGIMIISHYLCRLLFSGSKSIDNLGIAIAAVLLINPSSACDVGFLMSVSSCLAIFTFAPSLRNLIFRKLKIKINDFTKFIVNAFSVSTVAFTAVLPISAIVFGEISLAAPFSNIFTGFLTQYSIIFGLLSIALGIFPALGYFANGAAILAMLCNSAILFIAKTFAKIPFSYIDASEPWLYFWILGAVLLFIIPALAKNSFKYLLHSAALSAFVLIFAILLDYIFGFGVSEIKITALEHGTAISCSKDGESVLVVNGLGSYDRLNFDFEGANYDVIISIAPDSGFAEYDLVDNSKPEIALLSTEDSVLRYEGAAFVKEGKITLSENDFLEIFPDSAVCFKTNGVTLLYIFAECDIMDISPEFRRADIIILDGVSPADYPALRCDYLVLRKESGYYSGTNEVITLKNGETLFFAHEGRLKKGRFAE